MFLIDVPLTELPRRSLVSKNIRRTKPATNQVTGKCATSSRTRNLRSTLQSSAFFSEKRHFMFDARKRKKTRLKERNDLTTTTRPTATMTTATRATTTTATTTTPATLTTKIKTKKLLSILSTIFSLVYRWDNWTLTTTTATTTTKTTMSTTTTTKATSL